MGATTIALAAEGANSVSHIPRVVTKIEAQILLLNYMLVKVPPFLL